MRCSPAPLLVCPRKHKGDKHRYNAHRSLAPHTRRGTFSFLPFRAAQREEATRRGRGSSPMRRCRPLESNPPTHTSQHTLPTRIQAKSPPHISPGLMSGAGRKSAYRKSVTEEVLNSYPEPDVAAGERVAQVVQSRGGNILQVCLAWACKCVCACVWRER